MELKVYGRRIIPICWGAWFQPNPKIEIIKRYLFIGGWKIPFTKRLFLIQIPFYKNVPVA